MKLQKLSIVIPTFNEAKTIGEVIRRSADAVRKLGLLEEIIVVDDGSTDDTRDKVQIPDVNIRYIKQEVNTGKGAALKRGFQSVTGEVIIIQDADLEYDPADYAQLLKPIQEDRADVVYGSRFHGTHQRKLYFWHRLGNSLLTLLSNAFTNLDLSDMETGYKVFRREVIERIRDHLHSKRFGIEPELTARVARGKWRVYEVPINYYGRTYEEGKKIGWRDGIAAIWAILRFNLWDT